MRAGDSDGLGNKRPSENEVSTKYSEKRYKAASRKQYGEYDKAQQRRRFLCWLTIKKKRFQTASYPIWQPCLRLPPRRRDMQLRRSTRRIGSFRNAIPMFMFRRGAGRNGLFGRTPKAV